MHELRYQNESKLDDSAIKSCEAVLQILEECAIQVLPPPEVSYSNAVSQIHHRHLYYVIEGTQYIAPKIKVCPWD